MGLDKFQSIEFNVFQFVVDLKAGGRGEEENFVDSEAF